MHCFSSVCHLWSANHDNTRVTLNKIKNIEKGVFVFSVILIVSEIIYYFYELVLFLAVLYSQDFVVQFLWLVTP